MASRLSEGSLMGRVRTRFKLTDLRRGPSKLSLGSSQSLLDEKRFPVSLMCFVLSTVTAVMIIACASLFIILEVFVSKTQFQVKEYNSDTLALLGSTIDLMEQGNSRRAKAVVDSVSATARELEADLERLRVSAMAVFLGVCGVMLVLGILAGRCIVGRTTKPLRTITGLMQQFGTLDLSDSTHALARLRRGKRSRIVEVQQMQNAAFHLSHGIELFARYMPETVVRAIVRGDERAKRPHVYRRDATIMFTDIKDFTAICESIKEEDLLFMLTRYFSIMTRIVESYDGVVAEILGDGLLVYWNAPDTVEDHATKACVAALAQQQALEPLNEEFAGNGLPQIGIRIGLHTGTVLSGSIGSELKMKFGCMGDPVNLASRMEGLCKFYGVSILCSRDTLSLIRPSVGLASRQIDYVQVKGKLQATRIYELLGLNEDDGSDDSCSTLAEWNRTSVSEHVGNAMGASAKALRAFDGLARNPFMQNLRGVARRMSVASTAPGALARRMSVASTAAGGLGRRMSMASRVSVASVDSAALDRRNSSRAMSSGTSSRTIPLSRRRSRLECEPTDVDVKILAASYERALISYQQARFQEARMILEELRVDNPSDTATMLLLERVQEHFSPEGEEVVMSAAERAEWTGIRIMPDK